MVLHPYVKAGILAAVFLAGCSGSAWVTKIYYTGKISDMQTTANNERLEAVDAERKKREKVEKELAESDRLYFSNLRAKENEIQTLNDRLASGDIGLYVKADCPANGMPEAPGTERRPTSNTAKLNRESEQFYIHHRQLTAQYEETLKLCQDYVRTIQQQFTF